MLHPSPHSSPHPDVIAAARSGEPERYLAALLAPDAVRADLLAVAAFAAEMRRIPTLVKEPMMGEVRLQWWRDTIDGFAAAVPSGHAIADALGDATRRHRLPVAVLTAMTEARAFDLYTDPMPDAASFSGYLNKTESAVFALGMQIAGADTAPASLADTAGRAFGQARLLADLPHWLAKGRLPLPLDLLRAANISADDLLQGNPTPGLTTLFATNCRDIEAAHTAARRQAASLTPRQRTALLPLATIPAYVKAITAPGRDALHTPAELIPLTRVWRIARAHWLGL